MLTSQEKAAAAAEVDPLKKMLESLEEDWYSYKKSIPGHRRSRSTANVTLNNNIDHSGGILSLSLGLLDNSPKKLLSSLQQCHSPEYPYTKRRIQGRSLLEALESVKDADDVSPVCGSCSSVLIQGEGSCSCSCSCSFQASDSSSSSLAPEVVEVEGEVRRSREERWVVRMIRIFVAIWVMTIGIILAMVGFGVEEEYGEYITPT